MPPADTTTTSKSTADETAALKSDIEAIRKDIKQLFSDLKTATRNEADHAGRKANELKGVALDAAKDKQADVEEYVREHPLGALAAAAGVGFILALLVGRN